MLDLFSIAKSSKAGQDAYARGQKDVADQYWSDVENSLKTMASAQDIRESAEMQPLKMRSEQAMEFQRRQAGEASGKLAESREQDVITKKRESAAIKSGYGAYLKNNPKSNLTFDEWNYAYDPDLGLASEKAKEAVQTQVETTKLRTAQTTGAGQQAESAKQLGLVRAEDVKIAVEEGKVLAGMGTSAGKVSAEEMISKAGKAKSDAEIAVIKLKYADLQAKATLNATRARAEGKSLADMLPSQKKNQIQVDAIEALIAEGMDPGEAYNQVVNQPKTLSYANVSSMLNSLRNQYSDEMDPDIKKELKEKITLYESILGPALDRMKGKTATGEPTVEQTIQLSQTDFTDSDAQTRTQIIRNQANKGIRRIELIGSDGKVNTTIDITSSPNGKDWNSKYTLPDGTVQIFGVPKTPQGKPTTQPTAKPTQKPITAVKADKDWDGFVSKLGTKFTNNTDLYNYLVRNRNALISTYGQQKMLDQLINDLKP